jgi:4-amino-4-deoxy-L-arabinose transferase-like glycosyltransferase
MTMSRSFAGRCQGAARQWWGAVRRHWLFAVVLVCAAALRVVVQEAYRPALIFPDSERYLQYAQAFLHGTWAPDWLRTSGYSLLLMPAVLMHNLAVVAAAQHLLGLASAVLIYATLIHFGSRRWVATLATVPVLFDPLQLDIEQYVLTDVIATFLVLASLVVLVWKREAIGRTAPVAAGLLIGAATIIRESDLVVIIPAVLYLMVVVRPWRRRVVMSGLLLVGFLPPVLGYLGWHEVWYGTFDFVDYNSQFMYGRIAQFADCTGVSMPAYERSLCPPQPAARLDPNFYMWDPQSPQVVFEPPSGMDKSTVIADFDRRIIEHQPLAYLKAVAGDVLYSFSPVRGDGPEYYPIAYHQFQPYFPADKQARAALQTYTGSGPHLQPALASFLAGYGRYFWVPGPLLAAGLLLGLAGMAGVGRRRRAGVRGERRRQDGVRGEGRRRAGVRGEGRQSLRASCMLFSLATIALVVPPFLIATFDWRYEMPQLSLIPVAAVLGVLAMTGAGNRPSDRTGEGYSEPTEQELQAIVSDQDGGRLRDCGHAEDLPGRAGPRAPEAGPVGAERTQRRDGLRRARARAAPDAGGAGRRPVNGRT